MNELALYVHALMVSCRDPTDFHGINLVSELRQEIDAQENYTSPLVILALCNAGDKIFQRDIDKLQYVFNLKERPFWKSSQALALLALSCISNHPHAPEINTSLITDMSLELKQNQSDDGSFENVYTTALVMQAIMASGTEDNDWDLDEAVKYLITNQKDDGSYGNLLNTYVVLPVLHRRTLLNISTSHCIASTIGSHSPELLDNKIGNKIHVKYSLWFGDKLDLVRSLIIRVKEDTTFFDIMNWAQSLDAHYKFEYNTLDSKPYIFSIDGYQDNPENEMFWFLYKANATGFAYDAINLSLIDVIPEDEEEYIMWYKCGHWVSQNKNPGILLENKSSKQKL